MAFSTDCFGRWERVLKVLALVVGVGGTGFAQIPGLINHQGRLLDGTNLASGSYGLSLRLFDASTGGNLLFDDSNEVAIVDGLYSIWLGAHPVFGSLTDALTNSPVYLETVVNGLPLSPREQLTAVPYALWAATALSTNGGTLAPDAVLHMPSGGTNAPWSLHVYSAGTSAVQAADSVFGASYNLSWSASNSVWTILQSNQVARNFALEADYEGALEMNDDVAALDLSTNAAGYVGVLPGTATPWARVLTALFRRSDARWHFGYGSWYAQDYHSNYYRLHLQQGLKTSSSAFDVFGAKSDYRLPHFGIVQTNAVEVAITASAGALGTINTAPMIFGAANTEAFRIDPIAKTITATNGFRFAGDGGGLTNLVSSVPTLRWSESESEQLLADLLIRIAALEQRNREQDAELKALKAR